MRAVDAFTQFWGDDFNYVLGDFNKTDAIMDHIERDDAEAVVIVPEHTSKPFWNRIWSAAWQRRVARWEFFSGRCSSHTRRTLTTASAARVSTAASSSWW